LTSEEVAPFLLLPNLEFVKTSLLGYSDQRVYSWEWGNRQSNVKHFERYVCQTSALGLLEPCKMLKSLSSVSSDQPFVKNMVYPVQWKESLERLEIRQLTIKTASALRGILQDFKSLRYLAVSENLFKESKEVSSDDFWESKSSEYWLDIDQYLPPLIEHLLIDPSSARYRSTGTWEKSSHHQFLKNLHDFIIGPMTEKYPHLCRIYYVCFYYTDSVMVSDLLKSQVCQSLFQVCNEKNVTIYLSREYVKACNAQWKEQTLPITPIKAEECPIEDGELSYEQLPELLKHKSKKEIGQAVGKKHFVEYLQYEWLGP
jgi:hypothetical protein